MDTVNRLYAMSRAPRTDRVIGESKYPLPRKNDQQEVYHENNFPIPTERDTEEILSILSEIEEKVEKV